MKQNFTKECLEIFIERKSDDQRMIVCLSSDFSGSDRKSKLYVNEKRLAENVEYFWKSIKTKKLLRMNVHFSELDYYDNMIDIYTTPKVSIERGLKRARISEREHGCIPKEWGFNLIAVIADTTTNTPVLEVVKKALGSYLTPDYEKAFIKKLRPLLQKKTTSLQFSMYEDYED